MDHHNQTTGVPADDVRVKTDVDALSSYAFDDIDGVDDIDAIASHFTNGSDSLECLPIIDDSHHNIKVKYDNNEVDGPRPLQLPSLPPAATSVDGSHGGHGHSHMTLQMLPMAAMSVTVNSPVNDDTDNEVDRINGNNNDDNDTNGDDNNTTTTTNGNGNGTGDESYKSIIECGIIRPEAPGKRIMGHFEPFFGEVVEIFHALADPVV
jgi:hypothetical protein